MSTRSQRATRATRTGLQIAISSVIASASNALRLAFERAVRRLIHVCYDHPCLETDPVLYHITEMTVVAGCVPFMPVFETRTVPVVQGIPKFAWESAGMNGPTKGP